MNLLKDERLEAGNKVDIETKVVTTEGLADVIDFGAFEEAHFDTIDVREGNLKLDLQAHQAREGHLLNNDIETLADHGLADSDFEDNLGVELVLHLSRSHIISVVGVEAKFPVHHDNVVFGLGIRLDVLHSWGLATKSESLQLQAVKEGGGRRAEDLIDGRNDRFGKNRLVDGPKLDQEGVDPFERLIVSIELLHA